MEVNQDKKKVNQGKKPRFNIYWVYGLIAVIFIALNVLNVGGGPSEIPYTKLKNQFLPGDDIEKIVVIRNEGSAEIYIKKDRLTKHFKEEEAKSIGAGPHFTCNIPSIETFEADLNEAQKEVAVADRIMVDYPDRPNYFGEILTWILPFIFLFVIWMFFLKRMGNQGGGGGGGNIFNVGKSRAKLFDKEADIKINFNDVAGLSEAKQEVEEIVSFLKNPQKYTDLGGKIPKGALLVGPPGTGKTLLAKAVAGEANVPFFSMSGSDFVEMFVGVGASRVRDLFRQAKEKAPCIVFIDEIDAIGRARGKNPNMGSNDERENTLNQLLTEMDGFGSNSGVIILAATNRADILDKALMRAGRFDRQINVELPDLNERRDIFNVHLRPLKIDDSVEVDFLSKQTPGFSGADIANVCNEAALIAARRDKKMVQKQDFLDAVDRIIGGLEKKNKIITVEEKRTIAFHEAGHATVSWLLEHAHPLVKVTIVPRGKALGAAWYLPEERQITTKDQMLDEMCATLGGRAAEDLNFGKVSTGALNDLERVTKQAYAMVSYFGMSDEIGNISFYDSTGGNEYGFSKPYSEQTAEVIDKESKVLVEEQYHRAKDILESHKEGHTQLADLLLDREVIFSEDLERIFGPRPWKSHLHEDLDVSKKPQEDAKSADSAKQEPSHSESENEGLA